MGNERGAGVCLWCCVCFLVLACVYCPVVGGGCGCVVGLGMNVCGERTHCRVHVQHLLASATVVVGWLACCALAVWLVCGVCGGLFVICIVVASIFVLYCFLCFV